MNGSFMKTPAPVMPPPPPKHQPQHPLEYWATCMISIISDFKVKPSSSLAADMVTVCDRLRRSALMYQVSCENALLSPSRPMAAQWTPSEDYGGFNGGGFYHQFLRPPRAPSESLESLSSSSSSPSSSQSESLVSVVPPPDTHVSLPGPQPSMPCTPQPDQHQPQLPPKPHKQRRQVVDVISGWASPCTTGSSSSSSSSPPSSVAKTTTPAPALFVPQRENNVTPSTPLPSHPFPPTYVSEEIVHHVVQASAEQQHQDEQEVDQGDSSREGGHTNHVYACEELPGATAPTNRKRVRTRSPPPPATRASSAVLTDERADDANHRKKSPKVAVTSSPNPTANTIRIPPPSDTDSIGGDLHDTDTDNRVQSQGTIIIPSHSNPAVAVRTTPIPSFQDMPQDKKIAHLAYVFAYVSLSRIFDLLMNDHRSASGKEVRSTLAYVAVNSGLTPNEKARLAEFAKKLLDTGLLNKVSMSPALWLRGAYIDKRWHDFASETKFNELRRQLYESTLSEIKSASIPPYLFFLEKPAEFLSTAIASLERGENLFVAQGESSAKFVFGVLGYKSGAISPKPDLEYGVSKGFFPPGGHDLYYASRGDLQNLPHRLSSVQVAGKTLYHTLPERRPTVQQAMEINLFRRYVADTDKSLGAVASPPLPVAHLTHGTAVSSSKQQQAARVKGAPPISPPTLRVVALDETENHQHQHQQ